MIGGKLTKNYINNPDLSKFIGEDNLPNNEADGCSLGDFHIAKEEQYMYLCINGKGKEET